MCPLCARWRWQEPLGKQIENFLEGFYDIIPKKLISIFNEQELELLLAGLPSIDVDELKANTEYHKYQSNSLQVRIGEVILYLIDLICSQWIQVAEVMHCVQGKNITLVSYRLYSRYCHFGIKAKLGWLGATAAHVAHLCEIWSGGIGACSFYSHKASL